MSVVTVSVMEPADSFIRNEVVVVADEDYGYARRSAFVTVRRSMLVTDPGGFRQMVEVRLAELLRPWEHPDRPWGWHVDPFPGWSRLRGWLRGFRR